MTDEDPEDGVRVLARLSSSTKSSASSSKQSSKTFFVWGTGNEILVRNERVLGHDGNDDLDDDTMMHKDEESLNDLDDDDSDIKTKSISWSHLSSKNKQEIAQFEPLVKDLVQKIRLASASASVGGAGGDGATKMENSGGSDFRLEAAREFSSKAIEVFREIEKELDEEMVRSVSLATEDDDFSADDERLWRRRQHSRLEHYEARKKSALWSLLTTQFVENAGEDFPSSLSGCRENLTRWFREYSEAFQPLDAEAADFLNVFNDDDNSNNNNATRYSNIRSGSIEHERFAHLSVFEKKDAFNNESSGGYGGVPPARIEECKSYWPCILAMLAVGWTDDCVNVLYAHSAWAEWRLRSQAVRPQIEILEALIALIQTRPVLVFADEDNDDDDMNGGQMMDAGNDDEELLELQRMKNSKYGERMIAYTHSQFKAHRDRWKTQCYDLLQPQNDRELEENWAKCWGPTADGARSVLKILLGDDAELSLSTSNSLELFVAMSLHKSPNATARNLQTTKKIWDQCLERKSAKTSNARFLTPESVAFMSAVFDDDGLMAFSTISRFADSFFVCLTALLLRNATTTLNNATAMTMISSGDDKHYHRDDITHESNSSGDAFVEYYALEAVSSMLTSGVETRALAADYLTFLCPRRGKKIAETMLTNSFGMLGLRDSEAVYEFERLCAERGLNEFHRKNCNRVLAERFLEEKDEDAHRKGAKRNIDYGLQNLFQVFEHFDAAKDEKAIERVCSRLLRNTKFLTLNLPSSSSANDADAYSYPRGVEFISKVSDALRSTRGGRDRKEGSSASFIHARAKYCMSLQELKEKNQNKNDEDVSEENLECVLSCYEALMRQLGENCSPRYACPELICDAIPLFEGEYVSSPTLATSDGNDDERDVLKLKFSGGGGGGGGGKNIARLRGAIFAVLEKLESSASSQSNFANNDNINVDDDVFTTHASLSATLSPSIKDAIDVEKIALQDPKHFEDSALSLARIALVRLLARF
ncbi:unnamed protein product [Bathycoccus prasinos]|jgi:hypothetical protein